MGLPSDERLLADFIAGDEKSFASLVERYSGEVFAFVARFVRSAASAEDVVQETFVQVYQSASSFDPSRRFRPWLYTIAANKARDLLRSQSRKRELPLGAASNANESNDVSYLDFLADDAPSPADALETAERRQRVHRILADMPDHFREILLLGYFQRLAYKEIAEALSIPLGTVKSRLHAAVSYFAAAYRKNEGKFDEPKTANGVRIVDPACNE